MEKMGGVREQINCVFKPLYIAFQSANYHLHYVHTCIYMYCYICAYYIIRF